MNDDLDDEIAVCIGETPFEDFIRTVVDVVIIERRYLGFSYTRAELDKLLELALETETPAELHDAVCGYLWALERYKQPSAYDRARIVASPQASQ